MKLSTLVRIGSDPVARLWSGHGNLTIPADIVETAPATYLGGGELVSVPDLQQLLNGAYQRIDISFSGVSVSTLALALQESQSVEGALVHVGLVYFNDDWQLSEVEWLGVLFAGPLTVASQDGTRSISLSIGTDFLQRGKAPLAFFTDADQRRRSPDDRMFDHVAGITSGTSRAYGPR